jgi:hypothetical protein
MRIFRRMPSEGKGHTFESCRVRQFFRIFPERYSHLDRDSSFGPFKRVSDLNENRCRFRAVVSHSRRLFPMLLRAAFEFCQPQSRPTGSQID